MLAKSISRNVAADCYNNQFTRAPGGPEKQVPPIPVTPFQVQPCNNSNTARNNSPLKTKSFQGAPQIPTQGGAGAQASQNKYMTIQAGILDYWENLITMNFLILKNGSHRDF